MKIFAKTAIAGLILVAGVAFAKEGVQDPTVKARMDLMGTIAMNTKVLGDMAGGKTAFDAAAAEIPARFEPQATDPVSEAKPDVWTNWADFVTKSEALLAGAEALDASTVEGVQAGMGAIGGACKACHTDYRS